MLGSIARNLSPLNWRSKNTPSKEEEKKLPAREEVKLVKAAQGFYVIHQAKEIREEEFKIAPNIELL